MTTYVQDSFNRANGVIGSPDSGGPYTTQVGTFQISGNSLAQNATPLCLVTVPAAADVDITLTESAGVSGSCAAVFRYIDTNNYCYVTFGPNGTQLNIRIGGVTGTYGSTGQAAANTGEVLRVIVKNSMLYVLRGGVMIYMQPIVALPSGTAAGVAILNNTLVRVDDLLIQSPPADPTFGLDGKTALAYLGRDTKTLDTGAA